MILRFILSTLFLLCFVTPSQAQHIVIDPGHGGNDPGGTGNAREEKDIVLDVATRFSELLQADTADESGGGSWTVSMTRSTDVFVPLASRAAFANSMGADRFMSIHSNAFGDPSANGTETFSVSEQGTGAQLRNLVQEEIISAWGLRNRGNKTAGFTVLVETSMPAELHELGFITNTADFAKLDSEEERQKAAEAHLRAIQRHYDIVPYLPQDMPVLASIALLVTSPEGPVADVSISLDGVLLTDTTAADGTLTIAALSLGTHTISASATGFLAAQSDVDVLENGATPIALTLSLVPDEEEEEEDPDMVDPQVSSCGCSHSTGSSLPSLLLILIAVFFSRRKMRSLD